MHLSSLLLPLLTAVAPAPSKAQEAPATVTSKAQANTATVSAASPAESLVHPINPLSGLQATISLQASQSEGRTPLWLNANRYGLSSLESTNGYLRVKAERPLTEDSLRNWGIGYAADIAALNHHKSNLFIQQFYFKLRYRKGSLTIGQKEELPNLKPTDNLSTGSQTLGINAHPVPGIRIALDDYTDFFHGWMGFKGHFFYGMQTDGNFQHDVQASKYVDKTLIHTKSGILRIGKRTSPLTLEMGLEMATQFGGTTYEKDGTVIPHDKSLKAFIKAIYGGKSEKESGNYHSAEGNMLGSWLMRLNYDQPSFRISAYADHFFEDDSQMFLLDYDGYGKGEEWDKKKYSRFLLYPLKDILVGLDLNLKQFAPVNHIVAEYICSRYQSGPIYHDHTMTIPDHIGGRDNYMNHSTYNSWSHWGQISGNPLYRAPLYDANSLNTSSNRFKAWHLGVAGRPLPSLTYRILATWQKGWGTYVNPFTSMQRNFSLLTEVDYSLNSLLKGFSITGAFGLDRGKLLGDNTGAQLTIKWNGLLCR